MNRFLASLTALTLLLHAAIGCCWHHEHVEPATASDATCILPVVCGHHFHGDDHGHDHERRSTPDHRHSGDDGCGETTCQFVKAESSVGISLLDGPVFAVIDRIDRLALVDGRFSGRDVSPRVLFAGAPIYLRHQVLVI